MEKHVFNTLYTGLEAMTEQANSVDIVNLDLHVAQHYKIVKSALEEAKHHLSEILRHADE